jgi:hypothetical protein
VNLNSFFAELKQRNVYKVAVAYAIVAWLLIQIATQVFPFLENPNWDMCLIVLLIVVGLPTVNSENYLANRNTTAETELRFSS